jgi:hypothetical protein
MEGRKREQESLMSVKKRDISDSYVIFGSPKQFRLAYHSHPEPVELRWVAASTGQGSILEAVIHGR